MSQPWPAPTSAANEKLKKARGVAEFMLYHPSVDVRAQELSAYRYTYGPNHPKHLMDDWVDTIIQAKKNFATKWLRKAKTEEDVQAVLFMFTGGFAAWAYPKIVANGKINWNKVLVSNPKGRAGKKIALAAQRAAFSPRRLLGRKLIKASWKKMGVPSAGVAKRPVKRNH